MWAGSRSLPSSYDREKKGTGEIPVPSSCGEKAPLGLGRQIDLEKLLALEIMQRNGHDLGFAVDASESEILQSVARRPVLLHAGGEAHVANLGAERLVDLARAERAGIDRAGYE